MHLATLRSSFLRFLCARPESSIFQAILLHQLLERDRLRLARPDGLDLALGQIQVLEILQMLQNGLANVEGLGSACGLGEGIQAALDLDRQSDSYHGRAPPVDIRVYQLTGRATIVRSSSKYGAA